MPGPQKPVVTYRRGQLIPSTGDALIIHSGAVVRQRRWPDGLLITVGPVWGPGDLVTVIPELEVAVWSDLVRVQATSREELTADPDGVRRLLAADRKGLVVAAQRHPDTRQELAGALAVIASVSGRQCPAGVEITLPLTQELVGQLVGRGRTAVRSAFQSLRASGLVAMGRGRRPHLVVSHRLITDHAIRSGSHCCDTHCAESLSRQGVG